MTCSNERGSVTRALASAASHWHVRAVASHSAHARSCRSLFLTALTSAALGGMRQAHHRIGIVEILLRNLDFRLLAMLPEHRKALMQPAKPVLGQGRKRAQLEDLSALLQRIQGRGQWPEHVRSPGAAAPLLHRAGLRPGTCWPEGGEN